MNVATGVETDGLMTITESGPTLLLVTVKSTPVRAFDGAALAIAVRTICPLIALQIIVAVKAPAFKVVFE